MVAPRARPDGTATTACSSSTGSPATRRRCAGWPRRWPAPASTSRCPGCRATARRSRTCSTTGLGRLVGEAEAAYQRLAERAEQVVVAGLSMGGALTLWLALAHPEIAGLVCVNPATRPQPAEVAPVLAEMLAGGTEVMPGIGSDIADPEASESAYEGTPLRPLLSFIDDGLAPMRRPLRRADDAAAAAHVPRGPRRRADRTASTSPSTTAARSTTAGSSAATTWPRRTSTGT